jgi:hypothetical protein
VPPRATVSSILVGAAAVATISRVVDRDHVLRVHHPHRDAVPQHGFLQRDQSGAREDKAFVFLHRITGFLNEQLLGLGEA